MRVLDSGPMLLPLALAQLSRPRTNSLIFLLVPLLVAAVIMGLLFMHVLTMHPSEEGMGNDGASALMATSEVTASIQTAADRGGHAGDTCLSSSPQTVAAVAPADSSDLTPVVAKPLAMRPDPTGGAPDLFFLCVQRH